jgi:hypothetical protein
LARRPVDETLAAMRVAWFAIALCAGCAVKSFDYEATVTFSPAIGTVRLNHQPVAPGAVWAASYSSFGDALRDPSIVEVGERTISIGPDACAAACSDCDFEHARLTFALDGDGTRVTGVCGDGDGVVEIR